MMLGGKMSKSRSTQWRYGVAAGLSICVAVLSVLGHGALGRAPFVLPAVAILLSAYLGGLGPGLLATVACSALAGVIFLAPPDASLLRDWPYLARFAITVVGGGLASVLMGALRTARTRAEQAAEDNARLYQEAALARQEALAQAQQLHAVLAGIVDGVTAQRSNGELLYANEAAARITGFESVDEMLATPRHEILGRFEMLDEDGQPFPADRLPGRLALQGQRPAPALMRYHSTETGEERWVTVSAQPLLSEDGQVEMAINVIHDMTAVKEAEAQKAEFLAAIAHDLKTPLAAIKGGSQLMLRRLTQAESPPDERLEEELSRLDRTADRMANLLDELLDIEQLGDSGGAELTCTSFDLADLVRQVAAELGSTTTRHRIQVRTPDEPLTGCWDRERLGRVLANLIENAIKYSPDGGDVTVELRQSGGEVSITVVDQGIGVPAEEAQCIFQRYQRGSNVPGFIGGTGVGLAYARWVVDEHGGKLRMESTVGCGSSFTVELPMTSPADITRDSIPT